MTVGTAVPEPSCLCSHRRGVARCLFALPLHNPHPESPLIVRTGMCTYWDLCLAIFLLGKETPAWGISPTGKRTTARVRLHRQALPYRSRTHSYSCSLRYLWRVSVAEWRKFKVSLAQKFFWIWPPAFARVAQNAVTRKFFENLKSGCRDCATGSRWGQCPKGRIQSTCRAWQIPSENLSASDGNLSASRKHARAIWDGDRRPGPYAPVLRQPE